ncbi:hypothetical protein Mycsm_01629 [Mycobacterium sp. JS623]|nr:hypothetical protein Mycsm_01629 [Mycobacterium sp. JS623]
MVWVWVWIWLRGPWGASLTIDAARALRAEALPSALNAVCTGKHISYAYAPFCPIVAMEGDVVASRYDPPSERFHLSAVPGVGTLSAVPGVGTE